VTKIINIRLAVLLLVHKNANQVIRLIKALDNEMIDVFIHIDSKWDISSDEYEKLKNFENVYVMNKRISTELDTYSLVEATICLMDLCKNTEKENGIHYGYFALMSGQDYPIKNNNFILSFLASSYPKPLIDCTPYDINNWVYHKFSNLPSKIKCNNYINKHLNRGLLRKAIKLPIFVYYAIIQLFITPHAELKRTNVIYGGSAWWILPDLVVDYILNRVSDEEDELINLLKTTHTPEETFFQIMTMQSPLAPMVEVNQKDMVAQNCMTYAYFSDIDKPSQGHPYIFTSNEFEKILNLPHLFARKFDETVDDKILEMIDKLILY
jgi:hypothetical protein